MNNAILYDPNWWPHRFDPSKNAVHFIKASRDDHRAATFLNDEYLKGASRPTAINLDLAAAASKSAPVHFIFHSAFCCSTLLARAFDMPGTSMGLKEPVMLNDIAGWHLRGGPPADIARSMDQILKVLARPFESDEAIIIKPSNVINSLAPLMMHLRIDAKAVFLYTPLRDYLGSIARKNMWGRLWVRDLLQKQLKSNSVHLGFQASDYLGQTDLQVAADGWLAQHQMFLDNIEKFGAERIKTLDSSVLIAKPDTVMQALFNHYGMDVNDAQRSALVTGPVFKRHSKLDEDFDASARAAEKKIGEDLHAEEIEKVYGWAQEVANSAELPLILPYSLI